MTMMIDALPMLMQNDVLIPHSAMMLYCLTMSFGGVVASLFVVHKYPPKSRNYKIGLACARFLGTMLVGVVVAIMTQSLILTVMAILTVIIVLLVVSLFRW